MEYKSRMDSLERIYFEIMRQGVRPYNNEWHELDRFLYLYARKGKEGNVKCLNYLIYIFFKYNYLFVLYDDNRYYFIPIFNRIINLYKYEINVSDLNPKLYFEVLRFSVFLAERAAKVDDIIAIKFLFRIYDVEYIDGWLEKDIDYIEEKREYYYKKLIENPKFDDELYPYGYWRKYNNYNYKLFALDLIRTEMDAASWMDEIIQCKEDEEETNRFWNENE